MDVDRLMALVETYRATGGPKFRDEIRAAAQAPAVPEGWRLVPMEPTPAMVDAMGEHEPHRDTTLIGMYKAALAAAPKEPRT